MHNFCCVLSFIGVFLLTGAMRHPMRSMAALRRVTPITVLRRVATTIG